MAMDETHFVTQIHPLDVGGVRDPGVASLMLLAASLGWNVLRKQHQPVKLSARNGTQKRLATDSSCKLSVFQTTLSTIMVHTEADIVPTVELMDAIIAETKVDREHARRLRLAVGETPAEHRQRLANDKVAQRRDEEEHLTQPVGNAWTDDFPVALDNLPDDWTGEVDVSEDTSALREGLMVPHTPPFDGEEHGMLVSRHAVRRSLFGRCQQAAGLHLRVGDVPGAHLGRRLHGLRVRGVRHGQGLAACGRFASTDARQGRRGGARRAPRDCRAPRQARCTSSRGQGSRVRR